MFRKKKIPKKVFKMDSKQYLFCHLANLVENHFFITEKNINRASEKKISFVHLRCRQEKHRKKSSIKNSVNKKYFYIERVCLVEKTGSWEWNLHKFADFQFVLSRSWGTSLSRYSSCIEVRNRYDMVPNRSKTCSVEKNQRFVAWNVIKTLGYRLSDRLKTSRNLVSSNRNEIK